MEGTGGRKGVIDRDTQTILGKSNFLQNLEMQLLLFTVYCPKGQGSKGGWVSEKNINCNKPTDPVIFFFVPYGIVGNFLRNMIVSKLV